MDANINRNMQGKARQLEDVNIIRPIIIVLLVLMHSFTMYAGGWIMPEGIEPVRAYFWITKISFSSMLEMFVFVSGYLFAFQVYELKKNYSFKSIVYNKFKRLILPSIFFSIIYLVCFSPIKEWLSFSSLISIISGRGHMWFLPMLFWCFIATFLLMKIRVKEGIKLSLLFGLAMCSFLPLPFQIGSTCYYLLFFYLGSYIWDNKDKIVDKFANPKYLLLGSALFVLLFIPLTLFREYLGEIETLNIIHKLIKVLLLTLSKLIYTIVGSFIFYVFVNYLIEKKHIKVPNWLTKFNYLCFGIYLFQQFILQVLYYKTSLPTILGSYWLPWVGFSITMIVSVLLSKLSLKTKIGRFLIG